MGFLHKVKKVGKFLDKGLQKTENFGHKVLKEADKGLHIANKVVNIADKTAGALSNVPVIGQYANEIKPFISGSKKLIHQGEGGLHSANRILNKIKR